MKIAYQPVMVRTGEEGEGQLVFADGWLVGVLVRLSDQHEGAEGYWFLETGYGPLDGHQHPIFDDLRAAEGWIRARLADFIKSPWS